MSDHFHELSRPDATVTVRVGDVIIARSSRTVLLEEVVRGRKLDPVHYFPAEDVSLDVLQPSATRTHCPIKGDASLGLYRWCRGAAGLGLGLSRPHRLLEGDRRAPCLRSPLC